jgi:site-specific DNA-methyltransferase (adenine-specific)
MIAWVYGSGFPKSLDVSKAIDKAAGHTRATDYEPNYANATFGKGLGGGKHGATSEPPATPKAQQWQGWGTALKPALEPITVARKPLVGTVAENVLTHGTGGINVDGCRVGRNTDDVSGWSQSGSNASENLAMSGGNYARDAKPDAEGRWPANLIHDGSDEVVAGFPQSASSPFNSKKAYSTPFVNNPSEPYAGGYSDTGSAARFFYCAKASKKDREGSTHPTMKPTDLMRYLCRLVTPPVGIVLDPFMGSGSTGKAAVLEGFQFIGIEREVEYLDIATRRIADVSPLSGLRNILDSSLQNDTSVHEQPS